MDSLTSRHSGISNDILLFSDISLSLTHHYRVHRRGVPHVAFRRNYMSQLRALLPLPAVPLTEGRSPDPGSLSVEDSPDVMTDSSRPSRRTFARRRLTQIRETPRRIAPRLTEQDTLAAARSMVFDCRPQVLPGSEIRSMTVGVSPVLRSPPLVTVPEDFMLFNAAVTNQTQSSPSLMGSMAGGRLPATPLTHSQATASRPAMELGVVGESSEVTDQIREGRLTFIRMVHVPCPLHGYCRTTRGVSFE